MLRIYTLLATFVICSCSASTSDVYLSDAPPLSSLPSKPLSDVSRDVCNPVQSTQAAAEAKTQDSGGYTPLHHAASGGDTEAVQLLLSQPGVDLNAKDKYGSTPLHYAALEGSREVAVLFIQNKVDINVQDQDGYTAKWSKCKHPKSVW